jgi:trehalose 6-phosphate synthase/phosphatase
MSERLLIVSNRLPVQLDEHDGLPVFVPSAGGLVSSIKSYLNSKINSLGTNPSQLTLWIGSLDISLKKYERNNLVSQLPHEDIALHPVFLPSKTRDKHYNGFCNDTIWPLFHYFPSYARYKDEYFEHYIKANQQFCIELEKVYQPGDIIWIHDYHLMLLPSMIRAKYPNAIIGFFLHIPFPSFELFRMLPGAWRTAILDGLIGADLIGFHTSSYVQYFLKSVKQLLGYETSHRSVISPDRTVAVDVFPVGIDFKKFNSVITQSDVLLERDRLRKRMEETQLVISIDRLDYTKGILNRLEAFELFFQQNPAYIGKVTFLLVVVPSRDIIVKYKELKESIEGTVSRINGRLGSMEWIPIIYQYKSVDFIQLTALYAAADVALVTPIRDGMNLVAKEFVASRRDKRGVLILSEGAGAANELGEALIVNPTDRREIAHAIHAALNMPLKEQMTRITFMQKRLENYDVVKWADEFLAALREARREQENLKVKILHSEDEKKLQNQYSDAHERLILLDYDGTLAPIERYPHLATPNADLLDLLKKLISDQRNTVVITSGRNKDELQEWFGDLDIDLIAEHGAYSKSKGLHWELVPHLNTDWKAMILQVMNEYADRCPGSFVEEKELSVAWHFRNADNELGFMRSRELHSRLTELGTHFGFQVMEGRKLIEAKPRGVDKGTSSLQWINKKKWGFILAVGDDRTDEDLFRVIPDHAFSLRVGLIQSLARYNISGQREVIRLLNNLAYQNFNRTPLNT